MKVSYFSLLIFAFMGFMPVEAHLQILHLIPSPQSVQTSEKTFEISKNLHSHSILDGQITHPIQEQIDLLKKEFIAKGGNANHTTLWYGIIDQDSLLKEYCQRNLLNVPDNREGYVLHLANDTIIISAREDSGLLYGLYTLEQLMANADNGRLPEVTIIDYPAFENRSIMDDISRGPLSNMTFLKSQIKRLAKLKINQLTFYIEHVVKTKNHPDFAPEDGITIEEFRELSEFAKPYNIELIGGFQSLGHFRNILNSETYRHLGQTDRMIKPGHPESIEFLESVYDEMMPVFYSDLFGIWADEAWDLIKMDSGITVDSTAVAKRYIRHVNPLLNYLIDSGKKPIIAGDMLLAFPLTIDLLPKKSIVLTWQYDALENFDAWIEPFREANLDFLVCTGILNSHSVFPNYEVALKNIEGFTAEGHEKGAIGVMTSIWDDGSSHFFARDWPAVAFAAHQSWKPIRNEIENFDKHFSFLMLENEDHSLLDCISSFSELGNTKAIENLGTAFLHEYLLPEAGQVHYLNNMESESILKIIKDGNTCLDAISNQKEESSNVWIQDLSAWHFALDQIAFQMNNYDKLIQLSSIYKKEELSNISNELNILMEGWMEIKEGFKTLWLKENRMHWLDEETKIYDRKIKSLSNLKNRIDSVNQNQVPLPSALSIGIDIRPVDKAYFTFWLISEKYETRNEMDNDKDFLSELGGEKNAKPTPYDWTKYQSPYSDKIDFKDYFGNTSENDIVYLYSRIETEKQIEVLPEIAFLGKWKMILNGEEVLDSNSKDYRITLNKGKNDLILKLRLKPEASHIRFNIKNINTTNKKHKYKL